jgi:hypothetical protein
LKAEFISHGKCSYTVDDNIITIDATGPWNLEFFQQMHRELSEIILRDVDYHNFAILLTLRGDSFASQDGLDYHLKLVRGGPTKALAINLALSNAMKFTDSVFTKVYDKAGLTNKSFNSTEAAKTWLKTLLE